MTDFVRPRRPWDRTAAADREYLAVLGPGLLAITSPRAPGDGGETGWSPPTGGAWVHVGASGSVRAFTGKVEVGQGTRVALGLVVAEELAVPLEQVEMVMGDTDLCPWDMGTFGSRSMPDAAPALARASAAAREELLRLEGARLGIPPDALEAAEGRVRRRGERDGTPYGDLVRDGLRLVTAAASTPLRAPGSWSRAGHSAVDPLAARIVTGAYAFGSDLALPGMWHGAILWPPAYGARLAGLDGLDPGVGDGFVAVREGDFVGVAAPTVRMARATIHGLDARWESPPAPGESEIEAFLRSHPLEGDHWDTEEEVAGEVDDGLARATAALTATYRTAYIAHVPLEPRCALARWDGRRLTVWVGTQTPFRARAQVAEALGLDEEDVRIIVPPTGSGFGGKHGGDVATAAARLARAAGRPVRVAFTREEEFGHGYSRPMSIVDVRAGLDGDGRVCAWAFHNVNGGSAALRSPYRCANQKVTNTLSRSPLPQGSYRSLGAVANNFARESAIDELAHRAGIDPVRFRERNLEDPRLLRVLGRAAERSGWSSRAKGPGTGMGVAVGLEKGSRIATVASVSVDPARRLHVERLVAAFDAGAPVHPENLRGQVEGALVMALGGALFESLHFENGALRNPRLSQYRVPRFSDLPEIEVEIVHPAEVVPAGGGETPMIAVAPAVANAVFDATGLRLRSLPLAPTGRLPSTPPP